jgi:hypothetical protein
MANGIWGAAISMTIGGSAINFELTGWRFRETNSTIEDTAAGNVARRRIPGFYDWEMEFTGWIPDQAARHIINASEAGVGTAMAFTLKEKSTDTNPVVTATGIVAEIEYDATDLERPISARGRVEGSAGTRPTYDTTPLT